MTKRKPYAQKAANCGKNRCKNIEKYIDNRHLQDMIHEISIPMETVTEITDNGREYILEADLPGFNKEDIHLDLTGDTLTVRAERHSEFEDNDKKNNYIRCERSYGSYTRQFDVSGVKTDQIKAKYNNGILTLTMPKKSEITENSRRLEIE